MADGKRPLRHRPSSILHPRFVRISPRTGEYDEGMSYPPPLPIGPLSYDVPSFRGRPGIVTAMGVMSIVIACASALASVVGLVWSVAMVVAAQAPAAFTPPPLPPPPATAPSSVA